VPFNAEADSLNCAILAPDVTPDDEEFDLFVKEVAREMTVKAGQKCTAIRRAIVPRQHLDAGGRALRARLAKMVVGDPALEACAWARWPRTRSRPTSPSAWPSCAGVARRVRRHDGFAPLGEGVAEGAFFAPRCCCAANPGQHAVHDVEAFGPVSTLMPYDGLDEALALAARGRAAWWPRW
jgi:oxepin-CoA hydrolase / 3-oxo-5,6-dehydrosuberyl-CoA semialdehyde dehydrogenase